MPRPCLHVARAGAGTGEPGCARMQSSPRDWAQQPLLVSFIWWWFLEGRVEPVSINPPQLGAGGALRATLPAPHRCEKVPGVSHAWGRALNSRPQLVALALYGKANPCWHLQRRAAAATTFHQHGHGWAKAQLPMRSPAACTASSQAVRGLGVCSPLAHFHACV